MKQKLLCSSDDLQPALPPGLLPHPPSAARTPRPDGIQSYDPRQPAHHTTKRRGDKDRHWFHSIFPTGPSLCYGSTFSLLFSLYPILPSQPSALWTSVARARHKDRSLADTAPTSSYSCGDQIIYTHMCMCIHIYTHLHMVVHMHIDTHMYTRIHAQICPCVCIYKYLYLYRSLYLYLPVFSV